MGKVDTALDRVLDQYQWHLDQAEIWAERAKGEILRHRYDGKMAQSLLHRDAAEAIHAAMMEKGW